VYSRINVKMQRANPSKSRTAMISGHIDISPSDFASHYVPAIDLAISRGEYFILGDAQGTDTLALDYLLQHSGSGFQHHITIYPSRPYKVAKFETMGLSTRTDPPADALSSGASTRSKWRKQGDPRATHLQRDARMTSASDYDTLWARTEDEARKLYGHKYRTRVSATELNRLRRLELANEAKMVGSQREGVLDVEGMGVR
jgi:hypothetical protein